MVVQAPLILSYNDKIRPLLDAVDKLRHLNLAKEGIQLPTIVVVGDQSSGKSSVLESLAGISLPRGQGSVKGISNTPITLRVQKSGVPDLTMVDLPGITRVPVHGQLEDIYEQVSDIIMEYITPEETVILNVLSATADFPTCESIRLSKKVDKTGVRTLAVVTKADRAPEGLLEKVTANDVNIGLGYWCVRNRIGHEVDEEARNEEANLFATHPLLSMIDKSIVGIQVLAQKLVQIQAASISKCLPEIVKQIDEKLNANISELGMLPETMSTSIGGALAALRKTLTSGKESLNGLLRGDWSYIARKRERLNDSISLLKDAKDVVGKVMGRIDE